MNVFSMLDLCVFERWTMNEIENGCGRRLKKGMNIAMRVFCLQMPNFATQWNIFKRFHVSADAKKRQIIFILQNYERCTYTHTIIIIINYLILIRKRAQRSFYNVFRCMVWKGAEKNDDLLSKPEMRSQNAQAHKTVYIWPHFG